MSCVTHRVSASSTVTETSLLAASDPCIHMGVEMLL